MVITHHLFSLILFCFFFSFYILCMKNIQVLIHLEHVLNFGLKEKRSRNLKICIWDVSWDLNSVNWEMSLQLIDM